MDAPISRHNWLYAPHLRYGFQHVQAFVTTMRVSRGGGPVRALPRGRAGGDLGALAVPVPGTTCAMRSLAEVLEATHTDAWLVLHDGHVVAEEYRHGMRPDSLHLLMSCTKSYVGTLAGVFVDSGALNLERAIEHYLPELAETAFAGGSVRQHLDMTVGTRFVEDYAAPDSDVNRMDFAAGWRPAPIGYAGPDSVLGFLRGLRVRAFPHGARFDYRSPITDVLGLLLERVSGRPLAELLRKYLWEPLGCEWDACITVDSERLALANGGLSVSLRDFARFGQLVLEGGRVDGRQLVPATWIRDTCDGDDACVATWRASTFAGRAPEGHYRNQWWCRDRARGVLMASGIHGQTLWIDPMARVVVAKFSSQPVARDEATFNLQFSMMEALCAHFAARALDPEDRTQ